MLGDLISIGRWAGNFSSTQAYAVGDVTAESGLYYLVYSTRVASSVTPSGDPQHFEKLTLVTSERTVLDENFSASPGPLIGRISQGFAWSVFAAGRQNARVAPEGFMTSAGNTYMSLGGLPQPTEIGVRFMSSSVTPIMTLAISPTSPFDFSSMWHSNWTNRGTGDVLIWKNGQASIRPQNRFQWISISKLASGTASDMMLKPRGTFMFGYVDNSLAFVTVNDDNTIASSGTALYVQNHEALDSVERHYRVWVKAGP